MESIQEMERIIIADHLSVFSSCLEPIEKKIDIFHKSRGAVHNKLNTIDGLLKGVMKDNMEIKKEHESLVKQAKDTQRKLEVVQQKLDDLEQYG